MVSSGRVVCALVLLAVIVGLACGTSSSSDAGPGDAAAECAGPTIQCCAGGCFSDVKRKAICVDGGWACAPGTVSESDCLASGVQPFCTYLPRPSCTSCTDGGATARDCTADAGSLECCPGSYDPLVSDGGAECVMASDASPD